MVDHFSSHGTGSEERMQVNGTEAKGQLLDFARTDLPSA